VAAWTMALASAEIRALLGMDGRGARPHTNHKRIMMLRSG